MEAGYRLVSYADDQGKPQGGVLAAGQRAVLPAQGLAVNLKLPELDAQAWQRVAGSFLRPPRWS